MALSPAVLHILTALAGEDLHGYAIMQEVARQSENEFKLGPGTLYGNLQKLMAGGIVEQLTPRHSANDDPRRRYYRLTGQGRKLLKSEIDRLEALVRSAKQNLRPAPRGAR